MEKRTFIPTITCLTLKSTMRGSTQLRQFDVLSTTGCTLEFVNVALQFNR